MPSSEVHAVDGSSEHAEAAADADAPAVLAARIAQGEPGAEERLVVLYGRPIALILDRHTNGRPEAEDLYQDTFRVALEKLRRGELREGAKLPGFLARIARNLAIEHYRKLSRRRTEPDSESLDGVAGGGPGQLGELLDSENAARVRRLLGELANARDREILFRFYVAEEDKASVAADLGLSSLQFNRVLHRARQRYKALCADALGRGALSAAAVLAAVLLATSLARAMTTWITPTSKSTD